MSTEESIIKHLIDKYHPKAIILHGSRARGKNRSNSDWDLYVFVEKITDGGPEIFENQSLDVHLIALPFEKEEFIDLFGSTLIDAKVLLDTDDLFAKKLLENANTIYSAGRELTNREFMNRKNYMYRTLQRLEGTIDKPAEFFYRLGHFYDISIRYWFEIQKKWSKPIYDALEEIKTFDPEYYSWIELLHQHTSENTRAEAARKIYHRLFPQ